VARNCSSCGDADSCSCAIVAGANTTVTGGGTGASPFVINSTNPPVVGLTNGLLSLTTSGVNQHSITPSITPGTNGQVLTTDATGTVVWALPTPAAFSSNDTNCIDFSGLGTVADPLTADLILDPAGNLECTATGLRVEPSPNVGEVLTTSATGVVTWEPGATSVVTPVVPVAPLTARTIATHNDGAAVPTVTNIQETVTTLARVDDCTLRYTNEAGTQTDFDNNVTKTTIHFRNLVI